MNSHVILKFAAAILGAAFVCFATGCGSGDGEDAAAPAEANVTAGNGPGVTVDVSEGRPTGQEATDGQTQPLSTVDLYPEVVFKTSEGEFTVRLNAEKAKYTVQNFLQNYVDRQGYDQTIFHQVEEGRMAVGGAFTPDLAPRPKRAMLLSEADNGLSNRRGTIAMVRDPGDPNSAQNQFFFNLSENAGLDHKGYDSPEEYGYCVFGEVVEGMEVVDRIGAVEVAERDGFQKLPVRTVLIESVRRLR
jgi:peptidyl-prolyl cis-trans isomerase A (cyclophilin A)/peptidyl-prolyl cis-trans isomerase B (cyclophilin B)